MVARSQADQAKTSADVARESARATQAAIESAKAALESDLSAVSTAKLNLSYCQIRSPLSGRTGNLLVHAGNLVKANDVPLVVIHQVSPIFVNFNLPEQHLASVRRLNANHKLAVRVFAQDDPKRAASGTLSVIDNTVDSATGTIHLKATFDNKDGVLWPGQFVTSVLTLDTIQGATVVPAEAVQAGQQGQFIYVVGADNKVAIAGGHGRPGVRQKDGNREGHRARRYGGHRRTTSPLSRRGGTTRRSGETRRGEIMNLSRIFIERPVMTALISFAILLFGAVAFRALPVAALPSVDYPTIQVSRRVARRQPGNHGLHRGHAAGARVLYDCRHTIDELHQLPGEHVDHRAVHAGPQDRRRGAGHTGRHLPRRRTPAAEHAAAALLQ